MTASLDDRVSTVVSRTFTLDSRTPAPVGTGSSCSTTTLATLFAANNGGNSGGAVYFDLTPSTGVTITQIDINTDTAVSSNLTIEVYTRSGTFAGNEASMTGWTLRTSGAGLAAGADVPSTMTLNSPLSLGPTTNGIAIVAVNFNHRYTNGNGSNQTYSDANLSFAAGSATNVPFSGGVFSPRVPNMQFRYGCP